MGKWFCLHVSIHFCGLRQFEFHFISFSQFSPCLCLARFSLFDRKVLIGFCRDILFWRENLFIVVVTTYLGACFLHISFVTRLVS